MASQDAPLDEIQWSSQEWVQNFGGIHENTVLYYFGRSPFCEPTSNNQSLETQAMYNPSMLYLLETRELFEGHLRTLQGLEYMVALGPKDFGGEAPIGQGTWVIRKQNRRKRAGADDEVTVLATYFVVGDHIYMAPSVSNVIQARLLSTTQALNKLIATASSLPIYTPALGHRYFLPTPKTRDLSSLGQPVQQSRESTPAPDIQLPTEPLPKAPSGTGPTSRNGADPQTLYESFGQFLRYGKEYMDENPLLGEPGSFVFSSSKQHLQTQQEQAAKKAEQAALKIQTDTRASATPQPSGPPTPLIKVESLPPRRGSKGEKPQVGSGGLPKPKRRKSKAPQTPGSPLSVASLR